MATYTINIWGYGGELVVGSITEPQYNYWVEQEDALEVHAFWDPYEADETDEYPNPLTDDEDPRWLGYWHENDNIEHVNGAGIDNLHVEVLDEDGNTVWETDDVDIVDANKNLVDKDSLEPGYYMFAYSAEKGTFYSGEFEADSFDPEKLTFNGSTIMNDTIVDSVHYNSEYIENEGGDTRGKSQGIELFEVV